MPVILSGLVFGDELKASIIAGTMSVPMILGCASGERFLRMILKAVPGPQALSWMTELLEMGAI